MTIKVGDRIPSVELRSLIDGFVKPITTDQLFAGKKVVMFAVPGAFTGLCSEEHFPGFVKFADEIKAKGVDSIICTAVNDACVMDAWAKQIDPEKKIFMLADGMAILASALEMTLEQTKKQFGTRSQRYAVIVDDMTVSYLGHDDPGELKTSHAEAVIAAL